jgi:hypothetical protein
MDADPWRRTVRAIWVCGNVCTGGRRSGADLGNRKLFDPIRHPVHRARPAAQETQPPCRAAYGGMTEDQLKGAPKFNRSTDWDWSDRSRDRTVHDYYDTPLWYGGSQGGAHTVPDPQTRGV